MYERLYYTWAGDMMGMVFESLMAKGSWMYDIDNAMTVQHGHEDGKRLGNTILWD